MNLYYTFVNLPVLEDSGTNATTITTKRKLFSHKTFV